MDANVADLCTDSGLLLRVMGVPSKGGYYRSVLLEFAAGALSLRCDDNTDEIIVEVGPREASAVEVNDAWSQGLLGKWIEYGWELRNHRGYLDAFQLRLMSDQRDEAAVQFEVAGSTIQVQRVLPQ